MLIRQLDSGSVRGWGLALCYSQVRVAHAGRALGQGHVPKMDILEIHICTHIYSLTFSVVLTSATAKSLDFLGNESPPHTHVTLLCLQLPPGDGMGVRG